MTDKQIIIDKLKNEIACKENIINHLAEYNIKLENQLKAKEQECEELRNKLNSNIERMNEQNEKLHNENKELKAQLEQQKKENEEFKEKLSQVKDTTEPLIPEDKVIREIFLMVNDCINQKVNHYKHALDEIEKQVKAINNECFYDASCDCNNCDMKNNCPYYRKFKTLDIINSVKDKNVPHKAKDGE